MHAQWGTQVIGVVLGKHVNWDEVAMLVAERHRLVGKAKTPLD